MKVWAKRMIWYFGNQVIASTDNYMSILLYGRGLTLEAIVVYLLIIIVPLFMMGDDKK